MIDNRFLLLPEWKKGYIAGLFDGEGHIRLFFGHGWQPEIRVRMTHKETLSWLHNELSTGNLTDIKYDGNRKDQTCFAIQTFTDVYLVLKAILPYMITKKKQAELIVTFCELRIMDRYMLSDGEHIHNELRILNKRGGKEL